MMQTPEKVRKRNGFEVPFDSQKITEAARKAALEVVQDQKKAQSIADQVTEKVIKKLPGKEISDIETLQDEVESALMEAGYIKIARAYILYRSDRSRIRKSKSILELQDDLKLPVNSLVVLKNRYLRKESLHASKTLAEERGVFPNIARSGSIQSFQKIPESIKQLFVTAFDVSPEQHLRIQAAFQKYTDNSVSKTINLPPDASLDDVRNIYMMAYKLRCKGITIYRYGSKKEQVLSFGGIQATDTIINNIVDTGRKDDQGCEEGFCLL